MTLREIADLVSGHVQPGQATFEVHGPASLVEAGPGDIAFFGNAKYLPALRSTQATAVLVPHGFSEEIKSARVWVDDPGAAFAKILARFAPSRSCFPPAFTRRPSSPTARKSIPPHMLARAR